jgi:adenylate cyclase
MNWQRLKNFVLGEPSGAVPERVRTVIQAQQADSESLIAGFQLIIVIIFGALYTISPKTHMHQPWLTPVFFVLIFYFLFTVFRLVLALTGKLKGWFLYPAVVLDVVMVIVLIWSFHWQYNQPPAFSLKAPTLLYVFIFIALRALRFEPRYVLLCGGAAALCWVGLVLFVVMDNPLDPMTTRDYVVYMTSNSVLLGAEFDKIITILVVTLIIAVALVRARRLLERSVAEHSAAQELSRFFSPEIADQITKSENRIKAGHGEERVSAILTVDLRNSTGLSNRMSPDEVIGMLTEYQSRMVPVIQQNGGAIDKFLGDGILAHFGAAVESETFAADAMRAADELIVAADQWSLDRKAAGGEPIKIGISVGCGRIIFGAVGDHSRLEYTCIGEAVNVAVKLEKYNSIANCRSVTTVEDYELARRQGYGPPAERTPILNVQIPGVDYPQDIIVLSS